jgi:hypothetical protein
VAIKIAVKEGKWSRRLIALCALITAASCATMAWKMLTQGGG